MPYPKVPCSEYWISHASAIPTLWSSEVVHADDDNVRGAAILHADHEWPHIRLHYSLSAPNMCNVRRCKLMIKEKLPLHPRNVKGCHRSLPHLSVAPVSAAGQLATRPCTSLARTPLEHQPLLPNYLLLQKPPCNSRTCSAAAGISALFGTAPARPAALREKKPAPRTVTLYDGHCTRWSQLQCSEIKWHGSIDRCRFFQRSYRGQCVPKQFTLQREALYCARVRGSIKDVKKA
jgi:hypothetical protein